ncbi:MAG: sigma-54 dependent transcriptional regulator [Candidatus Poribacteria bacterium]|nr:sigma-54 dependent transcriptional regulator [Candidatus Poribacteria bacterium]
MPFPNRVHDFLSKPISLPELAESIKRTKRYQALLREQRDVAEQHSTSPSGRTELREIDSLVGKSEAIQDIIGTILRLKNNDTVTVLITGESGTGKELIARAIHFESPRASRPFVPVNCAAIPAYLAESAFFGHVYGAFTGATTNRTGHFEFADGGTLFFDEIGEMPVEIQTKLLRVLEDGVVTPVGAMTGRRMDVRVLASTNTDLRTKIEAGTFRPDLYFRLAQFTIAVPPLRAHPEDIPLLADHFLGVCATRMTMDPPILTPEAISDLEGYPFPGNVRELKNIIERAMIESGGAAIQPEHLHFAHTLASPADSEPVAFYKGRFVDVRNLSLEYQGQGNPQGFLEALLTPIQEAQQSLEREIILEALRQNRGNRGQTAKALGIGRKTLYRKLKEHQIE